MPLPLSFPPFNVKHKGREGLGRERPLPTRPGPRPPRRRRLRVCLHSWGACWHPTSRRKAPRGHLFTLGLAAPSGSSFLGDEKKADNLSGKQGHCSQGCQGPFVGWPLRSAPPGRGLTQGKGGAWLERSAALRPDTGRLIPDFSSKPSLHSEPCLCRRGLLMSPTSRYGARCHRWGN